MWGATLRVLPARRQFTSAYKTCYRESVRGQTSALGIYEDEQAPGDPRELTAKTGGEALHVVQQAVSRTRAPGEGKWAPIQPGLLSPSHVPGAEGRSAFF